MNDRWPNHVGVWREWRAALNSDRMQHAWLLAGKQGLGKRDFADEAARELIAAPGVRQPAEHPDIAVLTHLPKDDKEAKKRDEGKPYQTKRNIAVDQIRAMQRSLTTRPTLGSRRAIIIDPSDDMEKSASNALLKSLEEPPRGTFFLLIAHRPSRLLPTIRSRCRVLRFVGLSDAELASKLEKHGYVADPAVLQAAAGSYGAAVRFLEQELGPLASLIDQLLGGADGAFTAKGEFARQIGPRADRERLQTILDLAQTLTASHARTTVDRARREHLVEAHAELVKLAAQAPTYNFDAGLLGQEIAGLLVRASTASEHAHGAH